MGLFVTLVAFSLIFPLVLLQSATVIPHLKRKIWNYNICINDTSFLIFYSSRAVINLMHDLGPHTVDNKIR